MNSALVNREDSESFRQYQYAQVTDPLYPALHRKALPVSRWEVAGTSNRIIGVYLLVGPHEIFFQRAQVRLFLGDASHVALATKQFTAGIFARFKRYLSFPHSSKF